MPYAVRNPQGQLTSLHRHDPGVGDWVAADDADVQQFLGLTAPGVEPASGARAGAGAGAVQAFEQLDADFIRVLEDVIDALMSRNLLNITDLPEEAQSKLFQRRSFRDRRPSSALDLYRVGEYDGLKL
jgi:hypothetical protein